MRAWQQKIEPHHGEPCEYFITDISEFPPHWHKELEIVYVLGEELRIGQNGEVFDLTTGDVFLSSAGDIHYFPNQSARCDRIILQFDPAALDTASYFHDKRIASPLIAEGSAGEAHALLEKDILDIGMEIALKREGHILAIKARLYDLLLHILRNVPMEEVSLEQRSRQGESLRRLDLVFQYVDAHYRREIYLEEAAEAANYSVFHFTRFFKKTTGMTFFEYLNKLRISKAAELLVGSDAPVAEIAFAAGFSSIKTFNRLFKLNHGISPHEYRKSKI